MYWLQGVPYLYFFLKLLDYYKGYTLLYLIIFGEEKGWGVDFYNFCSSPLTKGSSRVTLIRKNELSLSLSFSFLFLSREIRDEIQKIESVVSDSHSLAEILYYSSQSFDFIISCSYCSCIRLSRRKFCLLHWSKLTNHFQKMCVNLLHGSHLFWTEMYILRGERGIVL